MTVKQISVFVENKPGQLAKFAHLLREHEIDMRAISLAETRDFGILRVIVNDAYKAACVLKEEGYIFSITPVLAVAIPDVTGGLVEILDLLGENEINLEYTYVIITRRKDLAYMILRVGDDENDKAIEVLSGKGYTLVCQQDLSEI